MSDAASPLLAGMTRLKSYVRKRMRDPEGVEDVVQETLARVMEQERRQAIEQPLAYAFRVADSVIVSDLRKHRRAGSPTGRQADAHPLELDPLELVCDMPLADEVLDYRERFARFEAALARLTPMRRTVFRMRHIDGQSRQDIAEELGLGLEAVKKHLVRAMADLALALESDLETAAED
ncbi:RNA polymerase subunit sigma-70 [Sphingomonas sp. IC081]|nr:RNA polymerase subunit sigma-70 [Sphingomonas sp. IC081]